MLTNKEISKLIEEKNKFKVKCICGHSIVISPRKDYKICSWCGKKVVNKRKIFKENLLEKMEGKNGN